MVDTRKRMLDCGAFVEPCAAVRTTLGSNRASAWCSGSLAADDGPDEVGVELITWRL